MATNYSFSVFLSHCRNCGKLSDGLVKHLSSIAHEHHFRVKDHVYKNVSRWKSKRELADYLLDNLLLNQDGLIVLNKPYGVGAQSPRVNVNSPKEAYSRVDNYNLHDVLPYIGNALGVDHLMVAKCGEKYSSGVSILVSSDKLIDKIRTCRRRDMSNKKLTSKYLGLVLGQPMDMYKSESVNVALTASPDEKTFQPIIYDRRPPRTKDTMSVNVEYSTLCTNGYGMSLVEIKTNCTRWHFLRVYLAHKLAPLLGDNLHGVRVTDCTGTSLAVNPFNVYSHKKILKSTLLNRLRLEQGEESIIPCHIHLREVTFTGWNKDRSDVTVVAPTPPYFNWTCEQLNLEMKD